MNKQQMEVKNYLMGACWIDQSINCKLEQMQSLSDLATRTSSTISDMPGSPNRNTSKMEDVIVKLVDLQTEIGCDIDQLLVLKKNIMACIKQVENREGRVVLEARYLRQSKWDEIADDLGCSKRQVFRIHDDSLGKITIPES
jgi:DNA-directed RNA polymerase specialized sigma subunit